VTTSPARCLPLLQVKTLNYAPGPLDTDMQRELRESDTLDAGARDMFAKMKAEVRHSLVCSGCLSWLPAVAARLGCLSWRPAVAACRGCLCRRATCMHFTGDAALPSALVPCLVLSFRERSSTPQRRPPSAPSCCSEARATRAARTLTFTTCRDTHANRAMRLAVCAALHWVLTVPCGCAWNTASRRRVA